MQALRDSASIDSALKQEAALAAARTSKKIRTAAHVRDSIQAARKALRDSLFNTDSAQRRRHRDSLRTSQTAPILTHADSVRRRHLRDSIRKARAQDTSHRKKPRKITKDTTGTKPAQSGDTTKR